MREEHLKGWLVEAHKEEAAVARAKETEEVVAAIRVPGGGIYGGEEGDGY